MSLPSGYKRLEYIESTGTQYIDTNISNANGFSSRMELTVTEIISDYIIGAHNTSSPYGRSGWFPRSNTTIEIGLSGYATYNSPSMIGVKRVVEFKTELPGYLKVDGIEIASYSSTFDGGSLSTNNILLLANQYAIANPTTHAKAKIYSCIISKNSVNVRNMIPAKRNYDNAIGMYDLVTNTFFENAGTGTFIAGPVIAIAANKAEITELEYIQSSGNQYINSGFSPNSNTAIVMDAELLPGGDYPSIFGTRNGSSAKFWAYQGSNGVRFNFASTEYTISGSYYNARSVYSIRNGTAFIGENTVSLSSTSFETSYSFYLFACNASGTTTYPATMKLYSCQIYDNDAPVRDYIPAKLSDGTVGLYDKLNGLLYINAGTGTFEAGPSSLNLPVNIGGTWKDANEAFVNIGGTWKTVEAAFVNIGGTWKKIG